MVINGAPVDPDSRSAEGAYHRLCCDSWTNTFHLGTCICRSTDMERQGCAHCREKGLYQPPPTLKTQGFNLSHIAETSVFLDEDGSVWIGPDEAFERGRFGQGKYLH